MGMEVFSDREQAYSEIMGSHWSPEWPESRVWRGERPREVLGALSRQ